MHLFAGETWEEPNPELILEEYPQSFTQEIYLEQANYQAALYSSFIYPESAWKGQFTLQQGGFKGCGSYLYPRGTPQYRYQLRYKDLLCLGYYNVAWGQGLVWKKASSAPAIGAPPSYGRYSPFGLAMELEYRQFRLQFGASEQSREAKLKEGKLIYLPQSATGNTDKVQEDIQFATLSYMADELALGAIYYRQRYDNAFADSACDSLLNICGIYLDAHLGAHQIQAECSLQNDVSYAIAWQIQEKRFGQSWRYQALNGYQKPAYASRINRLSQQDMRQELAACFSYIPLKKLKCEFQATLNYPRWHFNAADWQSEQILRLLYQDTQNRAELLFSALDREALAALDSLYTDSSPRHYRMISRFSQRLNAQLHLHLGFSYQLRQRKQSLSEGAWWEQKLVYQNGLYKASLSYSASNSGKYPLYLKEPDDMEYQKLGKAMQTLKLTGEYKMQNWLWKATVLQDLAHHSQPGWKLNLQYHN